METQSYSEKLLPQANEDKAVYLQRMETALKAASNPKDRALFLATKSIAVVWNALDNLTNPFTAIAGEPGTPREELEVATILMADSIKKVVPLLDTLQDPSVGISNAIREQGVAKEIAYLVHRQAQGDAKLRFNKGVLQALSDVKGPFDVVVNEVKPGEDMLVENTLKTLKPIHKQFRDIRRDLIETDKPNKGKKRR